MLEIADGYVYVAVLNGIAFDYSVDENVDIFVHAKDIIVKTEHFGIVTYNNLTGPYVIYTQPGTANKSLHFRGLRPEDILYMKGLTDQNIRPNNLVLDPSKFQMREHEEEEEEKDKKTVSTKHSHDNDHSDDGPVGHKTEDWRMRVKEHQNKLDLLQMEFDYWRKMYEFEFGRYHGEHHEGHSSGDHRSGSEDVKREADGKQVDRDSYKKKKHHEKSDKCYDDPEHEDRIHGISH